MPVVAFDALEWHSAPMSGSNGPVALARLPHRDHQAFRAFVRFPAGWARSGAGHYAVPEEFLILDGDLSLNGITWATGGYAWIPAWRMRCGSSSAGGCLAFAWFGGTPRWVAGQAATTLVDVEEHFAHWRAAPEAGLGTGMHVLHDGPQHSTWIVERTVPQAAALPAAEQEALCLRDNTWSFTEAEKPAVELSGPTLVRVRSVFATARLRPAPIRPAYNSTDQ